MATSPTYLDSRTGEEKEHPNAENIRKAIAAKEEKRKLLQERSDLQRKINYRKYNTDANHVVRPKGVRQITMQFLSLSKSDQQEFLQLIDELSK